MPLFAELDRVPAGFERVAGQDEAIVEREQVVAGDFHFLPLLAVDPDFDRHVGLVLARGLDVVGERFDHQGRVAGAVPVGGVLAVVDEVLHEHRRDGVLRIVRHEQLEVVGMGLELAAVPVPPVAARQIEVGGLVLVVLDQVLADVPQHHGEFFGFVLFFEREAVER